MKIWQEGLSKIGVDVGWMCSGGSERGATVVQDARSLPTRTWRGGWGQRQRKT